jgi:acetoin utilization protein AcuB
MAMTKTASEIMSKNLITIDLNTSVLEAFQLMQKNRIRHLPVTDDSGDLVGLLSERDVQRCIRYDRESQSSVLDVELNLDPKIKVAEAMSWPIHQVRGDVAVRDVALRMLNEKMSSMIVTCPETGKRGIVTTDDLLRLLISMLDKDPSRLRMAVNTLIDDFIPAVGT